MPRFYFTVHPSDNYRARLLEGSSIMLVAAAHWQENRKRFRLSRPPQDYIASFCIDSGGFTAARRWGRYPWTIPQYVDFIRESTLHVPLDFCAIMDYACEPGVNRETFETNKDRIKATIHNELACIDAAPDLPWLPVLQGDTLKERAYDLNLRRQIDQLPRNYAGIGSVCGRGPVGAITAIRYYQRELPGVRYHPFGMHVQALDNDAIFPAVKSWDSYAWNFARGRNGGGRYRDYVQRPNENYAQMTQRLARLYWKHTIEPRLARPRQLNLL